MKDIKLNLALDNIDKIQNELLEIKGKLLKYSKSNEKLIRSNAMEAFSLFYDSKVDYAILNGLEDKEELVRISALESIILPQNINNIFKKIGKLLNDKSWLVKAYAIEALADNNAKGYHVKIKKLLKKNKNDELLVHIYYALIKFGERKYLKKLLKMLKHENYRVRCATSNSLYYLTDDENIQLILRNLKKALKVEKTKAGHGCINGTILDLSLEI